MITNAELYIAIWMAILGNVILYLLLALHLKTKFDALERRSDPRAEAR